MSEHVDRPRSASDPTRVLVVDDSPEARQTARRALEREGIEVAEAHGGEAALAAVEASPPDLVLLDLSMPGMSGFEVVTHIRKTSRLPVIVLSGCVDESERVLALELGADDYVPKPFMARELAARIRSVLRRSRPPEPDRMCFGPLEIRPAEREVVLSDRELDLTPKEFDLLVALASAPRRVFTRAELLHDVWGSSKDWQDPATVTEHVRRLRHKIEEDSERPRWLVTVRGVGYRFEP